MRAARFSVSVELLGEALHMPATSRIMEAWISADDRSVVFVAYDSTLPESDEPHDTLPTITRESYRFDWNVS